MAFKYILALLCALTQSVSGTANCSTYNCPANTTNTLELCFNSNFGQCNQFDSQNEATCCELLCDVPTNRVSCNETCTTETECQAANCTCIYPLSGEAELQCNVSGIFSDNCSLTCEGHACSAGVLLDNANNITCNGKCSDTTCCQYCAWPTMPVYNETLVTSSTVLAPFGGYATCVDCRSYQCPPSWTRIDTWYPDGDWGTYYSFSGAYRPVPWKGWDSDFSCCYEDVCRATQSFNNSIDCNGTCPIELLECPQCTCADGYGGNASIDCPSYNAEYESTCKSCSGVMCPVNTTTQDTVCNATACNTSTCCVPLCGSYQCPTGFANNASRACVDYNSNNYCIISPDNDNTCCTNVPRCNSYTCSPGYSSDIGRDWLACTATNNTACTPFANDNRCCAENNCTTTSAASESVTCTAGILMCNNVSSCGSCSCAAGFSGVPHITCPVNGGSWNITGCDATCATFDCLSYNYDNKVNSTVCSNGTQSCTPELCCSCAAPLSGTPPNCTCVAPYHTITTPPYCVLPSCSTYTCPSNMHIFNGTAECINTANNVTCTADDDMNTAKCCTPNICSVNNKTAAAATCQPLAGEWPTREDCTKLTGPANCEARYSCFWGSSGCKSCESASVQECTNPRCQWNGASCVTSAAVCNSTVTCNAPSCDCNDGYVGSVDLSCSNNASYFEHSCKVTCKAFDCHPQLSNDALCPSGELSNCNTALCCHGQVDTCSNYTCNDPLVTNDTADSQPCTSTDMFGDCTPDDVANNEMCCEEPVCKPLNNVTGMVCQGNIATCRNARECHCSCDIPNWVGTARVNCAVNGGVLEVSGCNQTCKAHTCTDPHDRIIDGKTVCDEKCDDATCCEVNCPAHAKGPDCDCEPPYHNAEEYISYWDYKGTGDWCRLPSCSYYTCPALHKLKDEHPLPLCEKAQNVTHCLPNSTENTAVCCVEYWGKYEPGTAGVHLSRNLEDLNLTKLTTSMTTDLGLECGNSGVGANIDWDNSPPGKVVFSIVVPDKCNISSVQGRCKGILSRPVKALTTKSGVAAALEESDNNVVHFFHGDDKVTFTIIDRSGRRSGDDLCKEAAMKIKTGVFLDLGVPEYYKMTVGLVGYLTKKDVATILLSGEDQLEYYEVVEDTTGGSCNLTASFTLETYSTVGSSIAHLEGSDDVCEVKEMVKEGTRRGAKGRILSHQHLTADEVAKGLNVSRAQVVLYKNMEFTYETREETILTTAQVENRFKVLVGKPVLMVVKDTHPSEASLFELCRLNFEGMDCPPTLSSVTVQQCLALEESSQKKKPAFYILIVASVTVFVALLIMIKLYLNYRYCPPVREHSLSLVSSEMTEIHEDPLE
eukprot:TRINITY_DN24261_c0_g1_i1.p1 TRINITY_DN24261_c0_g1~~TRINITY_DN24261_c0_g1_i1.p1  ORF type:complete len:1338 (+),score=263.24 TRINITY_DN24261_c0_g1_i1:66-4079(+)